jgi:hypothetical protein
MKLVACSRCGSKDLMKGDGYIVCAYCQSRFAPGKDDLPMVESVIGVSSDVANLLAKCRDEPQNRHRFASLILDIDPTNEEAQQYLR